MKVILITLSVPDEGYPSKLGIYFFTYTYNFENWTFEHDCEIGTLSGIIFCW
jgi:hypothetical protein